MEIHELFNERARENEDFARIIIKPTEEELNQIKPFIDRFPDLMSIDYAPKEFLPYVGDILGYQYNEAEDDEPQREIMKRLIDEYKRKGMFDQIHEAVNFAHDENYFLGNLTYYNGKIKEGYSEIQYSRDYLFQYDRSKWDWECRWPDLRRYMIGVMVIQASMVNDRTYEYLDKLVPAGIKFFVDNLRDFGGENGEDALYMPYEIHNYEAAIYYEWDKLEPYVDEIIKTWDVHRWDSAVRRSGRSKESWDHWIESRLQAVTYKVLFPSDEMYEVETIAGSLFMYNIYRFHGNLDGTNENIPGVKLEDDYRTQASHDYPLLQAEMNVLLERMPGKWITGQNPGEYKSEDKEAKTEKLSGSWDENVKW